jgi:hypothetical protein
MTALERWMRRSPVSARDLAVFRIVYAAFVMATLPSVAVTGLPRLAWKPPFGPLRLLDVAPPNWVLEAVVVVLALSAGTLAVGWFTRTNSIVVGLAQLVLIGVGNSYGMTHHVILIALAPLILAWSGWGHHLGVDARHGRRREDMQWPPRLLALCIGVFYLSSAIPKIRSGWLDPTTHAVWGEFLTRWHRGNTDGIRPFLRTIESGALWEALDLFTVALEVGMILAVLSWRAFRAFIAVAAIFHLGVLLMIGISFYPNSVAYGAFVAWSLFARGARAGDGPAEPARHTRIAVSGPAVAILVAGAALALHVAAGGRLDIATQNTVVVVAAAVGVAYLLDQAIRILLKLRRRIPT